MREKEYIISDLDIKSVYLKGFRYYETKRFYDSKAVIDFFKNGDGILFFAVTNLDCDKFPNEIKLIQHKKNNFQIINNFTDPKTLLFWVVVENDTEYVELFIDDKVYELYHDDLFSIKNTIEI
jgi:hypothetical protein